LETATDREPWLVIDHTKNQFVLFGQTILFTSFKPRGLKLFLVLASRPSEKVNESELLMLAGLKTQVESLASYISRDVRNVLQPVVQEHGSAAGITDPEAIKYAMILVERKGYQSTVDASGYRLAIPQQRVRHIHDPLLAHQNEQPDRDE
jgi:hypothetical protein